MIKFPECPECIKTTGDRDGVLVPISRGNVIFVVWVCTKCGYRVN